jgi:hypothetical protein
LTITIRSATVAHEQILALGQNTVFNMLTDMQKFVSTIVFNQVCPPRLWWSDDFSKLGIDGKTLRLVNFRLGIRQMFQDAWALYDSITGSKGKRYADKLPKDFEDDLTDDTHGYSFLSHGPFSTTSNGLLGDLVHHWKLVSVDGLECLSWDMQALRGFFGKCNELNELLSVLTYILPSPSTRVTEFIDNKLRNDLRSRNLHMLMGEMFMLARYHKMTNATGLDICIPAFYPEELQELTLEVFAGGLRQCETTLACAFFGERSEAAKLYHTSVGPFPSLLL